MNTTTVPTTTERAHGGSTLWNTAATIKKEFLKNMGQHYFDTNKQISETWEHEDDGVVYGREEPNRHIGKLMSALSNTAK